MNGRGKSDSPIVPAKPSNKGSVETRPAEGVEGRGLPKGNPGEPTRSRTQSRSDLPQALDRVRQAAIRDRKGKFTTLWHHVYRADRLRQAYFGLKRPAAPGVDRVTWQRYGEDLEANLTDLSWRLQRGAYRAQPVRRTYIPKADGRPRPLGVPVLEDKIVQRATVEVLQAVYEVDFVGFSYGFRPGRSPHMALDALAAGGGDPAAEGELGAGRRPSWLFWRHRPRLADEVRRAPDPGPARPPPPEKVAEGGRAGRGAVAAGGGGRAPGVQCGPLAGQRLPPLRLRPVGPGLAAAAREGGRDPRALRRRHRLWLSTPVGCRPLPSRVSRSPGAGSAWR